MNILELIDDLMEKGMNEEEAGLFADVVFNLDCGTESFGEEEEWW